MSKTRPVETSIQAVLPVSILAGSGVAAGAGSADQPVELSATRTAREATKGMNRRFKARPPKTGTADPRAGRRACRPGESERPGLGTHQGEDVPPVLHR